jgi:cysteinyl-tRNA synthetase
MEEARQSLARIDDWLGRLRTKAGEETVQPSTSNVQRPTEDFEEALDDDLNISAALGFLFDTIRETNRALDEGRLSASDARDRLDWWKRKDMVLALTPEETGPPTEVASLSAARAQARLAKDWRKSDELRDQIAALGWEVRDGKDGQTVTRRGGV